MWQWERMSTERWQPDLCPEMLVRPLLQPLHKAHHGRTSPVQLNSLFLAHDRIMGVRARRISDCLWTHPLPVAITTMTTTTIAIFSFWILSNFPYTSKNRSQYTQFLPSSTHMCVCMCECAHACTHTRLEEEVPSAPLRRWSPYTESHKQIPSLILTFFGRI